MGPGADPAPSVETSPGPTGAGARGVRSRSAPVVVGLLIAALLFLGLGVWQVQRLGWKTRLIASVDAAMHAPPIAFSAVPRGDVAPLVYRRVQLAGHYLPQGLTLVTGTSELGAGYWELVPLAPASGAPVFVNRGWLPMGTTRMQALGDVPAGPVAVVGLLRLSEPHGTWLRANRPNEDRWYSRDIAELAHRRGMPVDQRLFVDATTETPAPRSGGAVPGLTVVQFPNNHLSYALTWFALALMALGGAVVFARRRL